SIGVSFSFLFFSLRSIMSRGVFHPDGLSLPFGGAGRGLLLFSFYSLEIIKRRRGRVSIRKDFSPSHSFL
ncbi:MAG: hypothetical protein II750_08335, partial [Bacteroidaceae bacterium]|nr:hypothetical protein [Bacteroidaceae bacterium]